MDDTLDIAIVGLACRFPGARDAAEFWRNLAAGVESITRLTDQDILESGAPRAHLVSPNYVKAAPVLDEPGGFDAAFFGYAPSEARMMDPQHRILLELAYTAIQNAGCDPSRFQGRIGVFAGAAMNTYFMHAGLNRNFAEEYIPTLIVNDKDFLSTRISYKLDLKGPSVTIQTAWSTSLVAVHLARQSLLSGETDLALAGAVSVRVPHRAGYFFDGGGVTSPDGHVRAFDAGANGTVFGSGGGVVVLKRLSNALADGDTIRAIIKGSAVNNDGAEKAGYTAPSVNSQADAVIEALANSDLEADNITYVEAHGSGTPVGDPIEIRALTKAFRTSTRRSGYCAIGSVKTNVGHLDAAAGMAGLIKTALALEHRQIPASLNYSSPNPEIDFPATPFFVNTQLTPWTATNGPRRAGIMSTGMGGTNAHVVLEEAPSAPAIPSSGRPGLLLLSARTETALAASADQLREFLEANPATNLDDAAFTLQIGRQSLSHRRFVVCANCDAAIAGLSGKPARFTTAEVEDGVKRPLVLLLPGVGDHYVGMGRELYSTFPVFRTEVDRCAEILQPHLGLDLRDVLFPKNRDWQKQLGNQGIDLKKMLGGTTQQSEDEDTRRLNQAVHVQPALFTIEYAMARLWNELGVVPHAIIGHSMGEYVAACLAGVFSLDDALRLIVKRTQLVDRLPPARMLAVTLPEAEIQPLLPGGTSISLINGPNLCVVAGPSVAIIDLENNLTARGVIFRSVQNTHAFHSRLLEPIVTDYAAEVRRIQLKVPRIPFISNVTGKWITQAEATDPDYWARHTTRTARFNDALQTLWQMESPVLLEAGPGRTLGVLAHQHPAKPVATTEPAIISLRHHYDNQPDAGIFLTAAGRLWLTGKEVRWNCLPDTIPRRRIPLPTYPYEHRCHWIEAVPAAAADPPSDGTIHKIPDLAKWFSIPTWRRSAPRSLQSVESSPTSKSVPVCLIFEDECGFATGVAAKLKDAGMRLVRVAGGTEFRESQDNGFQVRPGVEEDYTRLMISLAAMGLSPTRVVHAWSVTSDSSVDRAAEEFGPTQTRGLFSLALLARTISRRETGEPVKIFVVVNDTQDVVGTEVLKPEKSTVLAPCLVIPQEYPDITTECIDIEWPVPQEVAESIVQQVAAEVIDFGTDLLVAFRNTHRWVQTYEPITIPSPARNPRVFRDGGVYLITGGLGRVGREISTYLATNYRAHLVLVGRSPLPDRNAWEAWLRSHSPDDPTNAKLRNLIDLESQGAKVLYVTGDVASPVDMARVISDADQQFGAIHGVIHGAGLVGQDGYLEIGDLRPDRAEMQFRAKVEGLRVLDHLLANQNLDFRLALSSLTSILGGIGQTVYTAANLYMDTLARKQGGRKSGSWVSVNWDVWRIQENIWGPAGPGKTLAELGLNGVEAMRAMELILGGAPMPQIIVSSGDLSARIRQWVSLESIRGNLSSQTGAVPAKVGASKDHMPASTLREMEGLVANIWQEVLGMEQVGLNENFFDLGGHSLLLIRVHGELRRALHREINMLTLFQNPTVGLLARQLMGHPPERPPTAAAQTRAGKLKDALATRASAPRR